jgi:aspartyl-tRNA(Asn)/glutamyl-tRNA(Gln) amidotransferase subunit C
MLKDELSVTVALADLRLSAAEMDKFERSVQKMLDTFSLMDGIDVDGLEPTTHAFIEKNRVRADDPDGFNNIPLSANPPSLNDSLVANFPERSGRFISIPNVL